MLEIEPASRSAREALARALFNSGRHEEARATFAEISAAYPDDDYALFGLGLSLSRLGRAEQAVNYLSAATTMRPSRDDYRQALRQASATLRARRAQSRSVTPAGRVLLDSAQPLAEVYDVALLDLDGVVYVGARAVPGVPAILESARSSGMRLAFVTNNASRTPEAVADHLRELGVPATPDRVITSAQAAARVLSEQLPAGSPVLVVGGDGLLAALEERGLRPVRSLDDGPVGVVQGFAPSVGWQHLAEGAYAVATGLPWVATNIDLTIPTARGIAPGNGTLVAAVAAASGREPVVAGKPELPMHREAIRRTGARRPLIVGDRLDTDIEGAVRAGAESLLVLTGVTDVAALLVAPPQRRPSYLGRDLGALLHAHPAVRDDQGWRCGSWTARADGGVVTLDRRGGAGAPGDDALDALRAACAAAWSAAGSRAPAELLAQLESLFAGG